MSACAWHSITASEALEKISSSVVGLTSQEAARRLKLHGENSVETGPRVSDLRRFIRQFHNVLIYILLGAAAVTGVMQHWTDTAVILSVVLINTLIGFIQENKAEKAMAAIRNMLSAHASVLRDGAIQTLPATLLVPGDIVALSAGDKVPADIRLLEAHALRTQEAILTGESLDIEKSAEPVAGETALGERRSMAYSGTLVTAGQGRGVVVATAKETEIGRISTMLGEVEEAQTPLTLKLARFSKWLAAIIIALAFLTFLYGVYIRHLPPQEMFMVMIGIAVSCIPEGLPAIISISMALGMRAMARQNAIVRHLPVIEALGSASVICTDKTGTLTRNELAVTDIITADHAFSVTGIGYAPEGKILFDQQEIELKEHPILSEIGCAAMLNNDASLSLRKGIWELNGDPTEGALMAFAQKAGHDLANATECWPRADVIPFSAEARYMATLHHGADESVIYIKGAPERILEMCAGINRPYWESQIEMLARQGKRVLAIARKTTTKAQETLQASDMEAGLTLLGLFGIMDAPREEAKAAIATCLQAGIAVKMITGDHVLTASSIGKALGIPHSEKVMTGADIERLSDEALAEAVEGINIYARMHPEHKLRLVAALQQRGQVVAMTGDGVNDAPALKKANIGIAMGRQGTEVAKEASDLVLADDNFASIAHAVEQGRNIYRNIRSTIQFMLVTDGAEGLTLLAAMFAGFTLPITPLQILWVNLVTAVTLSLAFAFAPHDASVMQRGPLAVNAPLFGRRAVLALLFHTLFIVGGTLGAFLYQQSQGDVEVARTLAVNTLVCFQIYYLIGFYPKRKAGGMFFEHYLPLFLAIGSVSLFQIGFTYLPVSQGVFATAPLELENWLIAALMPATLLIWIGCERKFRRSAESTVSRF